MQSLHILTSRHHLTCSKFTSYLISVVAFTPEHTLCALGTENSMQQPFSLCQGPETFLPSSPDIFFYCEWPPLLRLEFLGVFNTVGISGARPMLSWSNAAGSWALALLSCHFMSWLDFVSSCFNCKAGVGREHVLISVLSRPRTFVALCQCCVLSVCSGLTEHPVLLGHRDKSWLGRVIRCPSAAVAALHVPPPPLTGDRGDRWHRKDAALCSAAFRALFGELWLISPICPGMP